MILNPRAWRRSISRSLKILDAPAPSRWTDEKIAELEICLFTSFFSIRKLIESQKVSWDLQQRKCPVMSYPPLEKGTDRKNWWPPDEYFDLSTGKRAQLSLNDICNQFVHSYVYWPILGKRRRLYEVFIASDRQRKTKLYRMRYSSLRAILQRVAEDEPSIVVSERAANGGDWRDFKFGSKKAYSRFKRRLHT